MEKEKKPTEENLAVELSKAFREYYYSDVSDEEWKERYQESMEAVFVLLIMAYRKGYRRGYDKGSEVEHSGKQ